MPIISYIPSEYVNGFREIAVMEDGDFNKIVQGLSLTTLTSSIQNLATNVGNSEQIHRLPLQEIFLAVGTLIEFLDDRNDIPKLALEVVSLIPPDGITKTQFAGL